MGISRKQTYLRERSQFNIEEISVVDAWSVSGGSTDHLKMQLSQILKTASYSQRAISSPDPKRPTIRIAERDGTINLSLMEIVRLPYPVHSCGYLS